MKLGECLASAAMGICLVKLTARFFPGYDVYVVGVLVGTGLLLMVIWGTTFIGLGFKIYRNALKAQADAQDAELKRLSVPLRGAALHHTGKLTN